MVLGSIPSSSIERNCEIQKIFSDHRVKIRKRNNMCDIKIYKKCCSSLGKSNTNVKIELTSDLQGSREICKKL